MKKDIFEKEKVELKSSEHLFSILKKIIEEELNSLMTHSSKLNQARIDALKSVLKTGLPNKKKRGWSYTELKWWLGFTFLKNKFIFSNPAEYLQKLPKQSEFFMLVLNGEFQKDLSKLPTNITITELKDLKEEAHANILSNQQLKTNTFAQLNCGLGKNGFLLKTSRGKMESSINILYVNSANDEDGHLNQIHNVYMLEPNSQLVIIERFWCEEGVHFNNTVSESFLGEKSRLEKYTLGNLATPNAMCQSVNTEFIQQKDNSESKLYKFYFSKGKFKSQGTIRNNMLVDFDGINSNADIYSISMLSKNTHIDNNIVINHNKPKNTSSQVFKGVYDEESSGVFDSCVVVKKDAQKTKTIQKNNNILLSSRSTVNTNPQLEIFADDVECAHGSTIGEIDEAALFYLKTRGLSKKTATNLLLSAFVNDVTKMISEKNIKKELTSDLNKQLNLSF